MSRRGNKNVHIEYLRVYNDILKYEDVLDFELDYIYQTYLRVLAKLRSQIDFTKPPKQKDLDFLRDKVLDAIVNKEL